MDRCNMLWPESMLAKVAAQEPACWHSVREAVFSAGLKQKPWWGRSWLGSVSLRYSGNLSAFLEVRTADNQAVLSKTGEMLTPTEDIVRKWKETFEKLLSSIKMLFGQEIDLQDLAVGVVVFRDWVSRSKYNPRKAPNVVLKSRIH